ncbi:MAG: methyltransferase domain-containing protein [Ardenticatenaceae bacterium]|nr:methyltransferase domain-containing protein [Anaerolineales bacterium]MCB8921575.1 methyltransferase domain-containing protein [Ardenticatenaceae bacterium]MCB9003888.1 methyltransferase domain-containing protein [Ardenticatenaceae bacterium]
MKPKGHYRGTLQYLSARGPLYLALYGGVIALLIGMGLAAQRGWLAFVPLTLALVIVILYFLSASLWAAHHLFDPGGLQPHHVLFDMAQLRETDSFAFVALHGRSQAIELGRRLTTGQIAVLDVYNPQLTPSRVLARTRTPLSPPPSGDPRFVWRNGSISLLPLPNESVTAVILCQTLSQFAQAGDREILLKEVRRILLPGGRVLLAERVRTQNNWLALGPAAFNLETEQAWRDLLRRAGFMVRREQSLGGLIHCLRGDKPIPIEAQQMRFELTIDE